ncbi:excalibur calcium-binding domain-containing protein [Flagellimonas halotolerans]|uniref:Excalibur calcium-binding domain-containing protein n=1 Tax=Flagellimonas halotolerans TaxID=3112164 RepID=A0ABU6IPB0_9FLAO|nr:MULTISPECIES: excalibur calcium-binding domain-containing protein [unclassified Allomuricauda]MEC3965249.1 excalibur calcium-binding domain-containing protein [Muricauda sp. SYSU M86414]MEC4264906.1 excalibur calcium-binding domain-containing protein [Muricauda sp. SYSU M84420]
MGYRKGYYKKDGTYVQGHFVSKRSKSLKSNNYKGGCMGLMMIFIILLVSVSCTSDSESPCAKRNCSDFSSQEEAQSTFETNKTCYSNLDRDNDGIACEN